MTQSQAQYANQKCHVFVQVKRKAFEIYSIYKL